MDKGWFPAVMHAHHRRQASVASRNLRFRQRAFKRLALGLVLAPLLLSSGCAAFRPLRGVPVSSVDPAHLAPSRAGKKTIDLSLLVRRSQDQHRIAAGDVLSIYVPGVMGRMTAKLDEPGEEPPINTPLQEGALPTVGYPITVRDDQTIALPGVTPIYVNGMTLAEAEEAIRSAYSQDRDIIRHDRILVSLYRPREYKILVYRQEATETQDNMAQAGSMHTGSTKRGTATIVRLQAYENDVLHALAKANGTNGLPGLDAENAIYILRRRGSDIPSGPGGPPGGLPLAPPPGVRSAGYQYDGFQPGPSAYGIQPVKAEYAAPSAASPGHSLAARPSAPPMGPHHGYPPPGPQHGFYPSAVPWPHGDQPPHAYGMGAGLPQPDWAWSGVESFDPTIENPNVVKIPVRLGPGEYPQITDEDITLYDGDIVFIESRDSEVFYTGGLLGGGQYTLPRDYDLRLLEAISIAEGRAQLSGMQRNLGGVSALNRDVTISPSQVVVMRRLPDGGQLPIEVDIYRAQQFPEENIIIQPGDYIIVQYTRCEAVGAFFERHLLEGALFGVAAASLNTGGR